MKHNKQFFISGIIDCIEKIEFYLKGVDSFEKFIIQKDTEYAVIARLEMIGFAVKDMSPHFKKMHSNINWKQLVVMAKSLKERYFDVDSKLVYQTAVYDMPKLKANLM